MNPVIKNSVLAGGIFSATVFCSFAAYAAISSVWTDPSTLEASTGSVLSSSKWNALL